MRYFIAGNFWTFVAPVLIVGKVSVRFSPDRYAFFGAGHGFTPFGYHSLVGIVLLLAVASFAAGRNAR